MIKNKWKLATIVLGIILVILAIIRYAIYFVSANCMQGIKHLLCVI
jgi:hypothetical protein